MIIVNDRQKLIEYEEVDDLQIQNCIKKINTNIPELALSYILADITIPELLGLQQNIKKINNEVLRNEINNRANQHKIRLNKLQYELDKNTLKEFLELQDYFDLIFYIREFKEKGVALTKDGVKVAIELNKIIEIESKPYNKIPIQDLQKEMERRKKMEQQKLQEKRIKEIENNLKELKQQQESYKESTIKYKFPYMTLITTIITIMSGIIEQNIINDSTLLLSLSFGSIILPIGIATDILMHIICKNNEKEIRDLKQKIHTLEKEIELKKLKTEHSNKKEKRKNKRNELIEELIRLRDIITNNKQIPIDTFEQIYPEYDIHINLEPKEKTPQIKKQNPTKTINFEEKQEPLNDESFKKDDTKTKQKIKSYPYFKGEKK